VKHQVVVTGDVPHVDDLLRRSQFANEFVNNPPLVTLQAHQHNHGDRPSHNVGRNQYYLTLDRSGISQRANAPITSKRRQAHFFGQHRHRRTRIPLEHGQNMQIEGVERSHAINFIMKRESSTFMIDFHRGAANGCGRIRVTG
jgi:hypothetical protein